MTDKRRIRSSPVSARILVALLDGPSTARGLEASFSQLDSMKRRGMVRPMVQNGSPIVRRTG